MCLIVVGDARRICNGCVKQLHTQLTTHGKLSICFSYDNLVQQNNVIFTINVKPAVNRQPGFRRGAVEQHESKKQGEAKATNRSDLRCNIP